MIYLIIETSSPCGLVAITNDHHVLFKQEASFGVRESNELVPLIEMAFHSEQLTLKQVDAIVLGHGPGSFTGLRIGASVAKALSYAANIPIICVESAQSFSPDCQGPFGILIDAKSQGIYLQIGEQTLDGPQYPNPVTLYKIEDIAKPLENLPVLISPEAEALKRKLQAPYTSRLIKGFPCPTQMQQLAAIQGNSSLLNAKTPLDLKYFNTVT